MKRNIIGIGGDALLRECIYYMEQMEDTDFIGYVEFEGFKPNIDEKYFLGDISTINVKDNTEFIICAGFSKFRKLIYNYSSILPKLILP